MTLPPYTKHSLGFSDSRLGNTPIFDLSFPLNTYNQAFVDLLEDPMFLSKLNDVKIFTKPTRTGKNYDEISFRIPYLVKKHGVLLNMQVTPLNGIIHQNELLLEDICREHKYAYENDPKKIIYNLKRGIPTVAYWTNSNAYTQNKIQAFYQDLLDNNLMHLVSITADEMDTWSMSNWRQALLAKGHKMVGEHQYAASLYVTISMIASYSPFIFGLTATPNFEVSGKLDTYGKLTYTLINPLVAGEQKQYAHNVGWFGMVSYYDYGLFSNSGNGLDNVFEQMLKRSYAIEKVTRLKRASLIQCGNTFSEPTDSDSLDPDEIFEMIKKHRNIIPQNDNDELVCIMGSQNITSYDIMGNIVNDDLTEMEVYEKLNDLNHPMRFLLVKLMAGRGVTLPTVKNVMSVRMTNKHSQLGSITESAEQFISRGKSVNVGTAQVDFVSKYGRDVQNVPGFQELANCYDVYLPNTPMYHKAVEKHKEFDACTTEMLGFKYVDLLEVCDKCGRPFDVYDNNEHEDDVKLPNVDKVLGVA